MIKDEKDIFDLMIHPQSRCIEREIYLSISFLDSSSSSNPSIIRAPTEQLSRVFSAQKNSTISSHGSTHSAINPALARVQYFPRGTRRSSRYDVRDPAGSLR